VSVPKLPVTAKSDNPVNPPSVINGVWYQRAAAGSALGAAKYVIA